MILENNFDMQIKKYVSWNVLKKSIGYKWKKQSIKSLIRYINSFLEMTESEIANLQKITQSGVFRNRHHALETMKKILKEKQ